MEAIKIQQLDYKYILIENYKAFNLSELELVVLLLIDNVEKESPSLITAEQLVLKMNLEEKEIDNILVSLLDRKFISYETYNGILITSLNPLRARIVEYIKNSFLNTPTEELLELNESDGKTIFQEFENRLNRSLTPLEIDSIRMWFSEGVDKDLILSALNECAAKTKRITIKAVDKMIIKMMQSNDIRKEGYSAVNEKNKKDIEDTIAVASYNWVKND